MPVGVSGTCFMQPRRSPQLPVPHMVGINLPRLGRLSKTAPLFSFPTILPFLHLGLEPLNASAAWSSEVGAPERGEMSPKDVAADRCENRGDRHETLYIQSGSCFR